MPQYKLTYFDAKALGEPMRLILNYGGAAFEDVRVAFADWPALKSSMPFGQMPILEVDGKKVHQSMAITRYLGNQFGLAGNKDWESLEIDIIADTINDFRAKIVSAHYEPDQNAKTKKFELLRKETIPYYLEKLDAIAKANNGHFAIGKLTWADFFFVGIYEYINFILHTNILTRCSGLKAVVDNVVTIPKVKEWIAKRPLTDL